MLPFLLPCPHLFCGFFSAVVSLIFFKQIVNDKKEWETRACLLNKTDSTLAWVFLDGFFPAIKNIVAGDQGVWDCSPASSSLSREARMIHRPDLHFPGSQCNFFK